MPQNQPLAQKFVNLQYNTLVRWADGTNKSSIKCLMFKVLFFSQNLAKFFAFAKTLSFYPLFFL